VYPEEGRGDRVVPHQPTKASFDEVEEARVERAGLR